MSDTGRSVVDSATLGALRLVAGVLFWQHGAQKLFGWLGGSQVGELSSLLGMAGILEFFGGILIAVGLFTRPVALLLAGEMVVAYIVGHLGRAETPLEHAFPIMNGGELAVLFCFIFLVLAARGPGGFSVDGAMTAQGKPVV